MEIKDFEERTVKQIIADDLPEANANLMAQGILLIPFSMVDNETVGIKDAMAVGFIPTDRFECTNLIKVIAGLCFHAAKNTLESAKDKQDVN